MTTLFWKSFTKYSLEEDMLEQVRLSEKSGRAHGHDLWKTELLDIKMGRTRVKLITRWSE